jgi:hypothetical protein
MQEKYGLAVEVNASPDLLVEAGHEELAAALFEAARELLFNVVKHAKTGKAFVRAWCHEGKAVLLEVRDEGRGFDAQKLTDDKASEGNFGILHIRERIKSMGGRMAVESAPGEGTCVTLSIPLGPEPREKRHVRTGGSRKSVPQATTDGRKIRVLVAADHRIMCEGLARLLAHEADIELTSQTDLGYPVPEAIEATRPNIVILDAATDAKSPVETARMIVSRWPQTRVIAVCVPEVGQTAEALKNAGAACLHAHDGCEKLTEAIRQLQQGASPPNRDSRQDHVEG